MANRCARCQKEDVTLETFGVFRCPACGRVDADGRSLDASPSSVPDSPPDPFGAPPPPVNIAAQARAAVTTTASVGPPVWLFGAVLVMAVFDLAMAVGTRTWITRMLDLGALAGLATGRRWARTLAIVSSVLSIVGGVVALAFFRAYLPPFAGPALLVSVAVDALWLYVLFRDDTVRYFSRD